MGCYQVKNKRQKKLQGKPKNESNDPNKVLLNDQFPGAAAENNENSHNDLDLQKSIAIQPGENDKIKIIVPLNDQKEVWEKEYDKDVLIENVIDDYIVANNIGADKESFLKFNYNKKPLKRNNKISTLLLNESDEINNNENTQINHNELEIDIYEDDFSPEIVGKFFCNPFQIYAYVVSTNTFLVQEYSQEMISDTELNIYYNSTCSYCNGGNNLYISGGLDKNGNPLDKLWIIDLKNEKIDGPISIYPKYNHTMLYIPSNYIFFVGGNDLKTFYYDINNKQISEWGNLNSKRIEPALIKNKNFLYCFDNVIKDNQNTRFNFEKTDLCSNEKIWEIVYPHISDNIQGGIINQKFFGASIDEENNIVFLGGDVDQGNELQMDNMKNYRYNINDNNIEFSVVPYVNFNLKEKCFMSFKNKKNVAFILPNFNSQRPEVVFFVKDRNVIKTSDYLANISSNRSKNIGLTNESRMTAEFPVLKYDFNMPKFA